MDLNRLGRKRLVYRSCSTYNLYGGFASVSPGADTAFRSPVSVDTYRPMARDTMNRWLVSFVREHGIREAVGIVPGVALCANHLVVDPSKAPREVRIPEWTAPIDKLCDVLTGQRFTVEEDATGRLFHLPGGTAYAVEC